MAKRVNKIKEERIDAILHELESVNDDNRMFEAVKKLHQKPFENSTIYNDKNKIMTSKIVFTNMEKHVGETKRLTQIINTEGIVKALTKMSSQKSPSKDNIPVELLKNAPNIAH